MRLGGYCSAPGDGKGFARPEIKQSPVLTYEYFNPKVVQGVKGHGKSAAAFSMDNVKVLWNEVRDQVKANGCELGVWADMPREFGWRYG